MLSKVYNEFNADTLEKFDVVAVPLSAVRLTGSSPTDLRGNPWLQALIISDMVVRVKGVCQAIGRPIDLDEFKEVKYRS